MCNRKVCEKRAWRPMRKVLYIRALPERLQNCVQRKGCWNDYLYHHHSRMQNCVQRKGCWNDYLYHHHSRMQNCVQRKGCWNFFESGPKSSRRDVGTEKRKYLP